MKIIHEDNIIYLNEGAKYALKQLETSIKKGFFEGVSSINDLPWNFLWGIPEQFSKFMACLDYNIMRKKVLDLGCGSVGKTVESKEYPRKYEPWLCRALWSMRTEGLDGCNYQPEKTQMIGVDIGDLSKEKFPHKKLDLLEKDVLVNNFEKESFDLINASMLFNSPELEKIVTGKEGNKDASKETSLKLKEILLPQIKTILKSEGIFLYNGGGRELFSDEPEYISVFRPSEDVRKMFISEKHYYGGQY